MPRAPPSRRPSLVLLAIVAAALGTGAAASALTGASRAPTGGAPSTAALAVAGDVVVYGFIALVVFGGAFLVYRRFTGGAIPVPNEFTAIALVSILLLVLFVVVARNFLGGTPLPSQSSPTGPAQNQTSTGANNSTAQNGTGGVSSVPPPAVRVPPWFWFLLAAGVAGMVVALAFPGIRAYVAGRGPREDLDASTRRAAGAARAALAGAADALGEGRDPREVIIELYAELLGRIVPMVGSVDPETPDEIRSLHLDRLGIAPRRSEALTRLFEEARYSTHPMGPEAARQAEEVIRRAEADLARVAVPG